ncbi:MAG TPA: PDZ domain-containing protein [Thermoanaerobaculia bacterium]|jgi:predicted metalloprotease with PDZ domain
MKKLLIITLLLTLATTAFADDKEKRVQRTVIVTNDGGNTFFRSTEPGAPGDAFTFFAGKRAVLGITTVEMSSELREHFGAAKDSGVLVSTVEDGSPADKAGIRVGDVVTAIDGKEIDSVWGLRAALKDKKNGDSVRVEAIRNRARQSFVASVIEREPAPLPAGVQFRTMKPEDARRLEGVLGTEWRTRIEAAPNCTELQARIKALESAMNALEKKLEKK